MKQFLTMALCMLALAAPLPAAAAGGKIKRACMASDRPAATRARCGCIQRVANDALSRSDRVKVAEWFTDPHQAQVVKMSRTARDDALWDRYEAFGQLAQAVCR
ncbi:hypothetical protein [Ruegeria sp. HKCCD8929]|uniref:hypothetical protein n=1 Tax=Ruegeria sp. HKCCD8929 TaxID=2683006 RepID=UPI001487B6C1|nr:hypothetical protein [Ruegeria sp. HKCCD8929]